jgi:predicted DNA-binding transcriptional regulator AlpA
LTIQSHPAVSAAHRERYLTPAQVCELVPGMTPNFLSQLRFRGDGPRYRRPSPRKIYYVESEVIAWMESSARQGTSGAAAS